MTADSPLPRESHRNPDRAAVWIRRISIAVSVLGLIALARMLPAAAALEAVVDWVENFGAFAPIAFVAAYFVATVLMLPAWPLSRPGSITARSRKPCVSQGRLPRMTLKVFVNHGRNDRSVLL